ncbi:MAG: hypothetical protein WC718_18195 [Phycisphaerales bacterium]|jgi:hypothetical protein
MSEQPKPTTIFVYCSPAPNWGPGSVLGFAVTEGGRGLASHLSSSVAFSKHDMGLTSDWKHDHYREACPNGFVLDWVDDPKHHDGLQRALEINEQNWQAEQAAKGEAGR